MRLSCRMSRDTYFREYPVRWFVTQQNVVKDHPHDANEKLARELWRNSVFSMFNSDDHHRFTPMYACISEQLFPPCRRQLMIMQWL
eukprot:m.688132 g.688132  ORF g.688132 m.688132 type:complete len:86 (+) comp22845_c0_seq24:3203-3460(+)